MNFGAALHGKRWIDIGPVAAILSPPSDCWLAGQMGWYVSTGQHCPHTVGGKQLAPFSGITGICGGKERRSLAQRV